MVRGRRCCVVNGGLEARNKGVKDSSRGGITEKRCIEEVSALEDDVGVLFFDEVVEPVGGAKILIIRSENGSNRAV